MKRPGHLDHLPSHSTIIHDTHHTKTASSAVSKVSNHESSGHKSSGETSKTKKRQLTRLDKLKRRSIAVVMLADLILIAALVGQLMLLSSVLHDLFSAKVADSSDYVASGFSRDQHNMRLGLTKYAANFSSTTACMAVAGNPEGIGEIHLLFLHERTNRQLEFLAVVNLTGGIISSAGPLGLNGVVFNPSRIITNYTELFYESGEQLSVAVPVEAEIFAQMNAPEFRDNPLETKLSTWNSDKPTFTRFVIQPLFCGTTHAQAYVVWGNAITPSKYSFFSKAVDMGNRGFVAFMEYDHHTNRFITSSSYLKTSATEIAYPDFQGRIPDSELSFVAETQQDHYMGTLNIDDTSYIYSIDHVMKSSIGDAELDIFHPKAVYVFGLPSTAIKSTVMHLLVWHLPVIAFIVIMSAVAVYLLIKKFVQPMQHLLDSVKKKKINDFNESIRAMKSNKSVFWIFLLQLLLLEALLGGLIVVNRRILEAAVADFTSASEEGPEIAALVADKHRDIAAYLQGWAGFDGIINQTRAGNFSGHTVHELNDAAAFLNVSSVSIIGANTLVLESTMKAALGKPFPLDALISFFNASTESRRAIVTTNFWTPDEFEHFIPAETQTSVSMEPAVVKIMASPISSISEEGNSLVQGDVIGAIVAVDLVNGHPSLLESSVGVFRTGYFGLYAWNRFKREFQLLTSRYKQSKTDPELLNVELGENGHDVLSRGLSSSFSSSRLYVEDHVMIDSKPTTVAIVPLIPVHEPSFDECTLHAYVVRGLDDTEWLDLLRHQSEFEFAIMAVELIAAMLVLGLTYWPMNRFLKSMEKAFNVPSLSRTHREKIDRHAASIMGLDQATRSASAGPIMHSTAGQVVHSTGTESGQVE